jgi:hypothetical protein
MRANAAVLALLCCSAPLPLALADEAPPAPAPVPAASQQCIDASAVDRTIVVDDQNILYVTHGRKVWNNHLPQPCNNLKFQGGFKTVVRASAICEHDSITVLQFGNFCFLGPFTPDNRPLSEIP